MPSLNVSILGQGLFIKFKARIDNFPFSRAQGTLAVLLFIEYCVKVLLVQAIPRARCGINDKGDTAGQDVKDDPASADMIGNSPRRHYLLA